MKHSTISTLSLVGLVVSACSDDPATSSGTSGSESNAASTSAASTTAPDPTTGTTGDSSTDDETSGTSQTTDIPTTGEPTTGSTGTTDMCGDGVLQPGEGCDDGPGNGPGRPCDANCQPMPACGDGVVGDGEECDDGPDNADGNSCTADCTDNVCGDGKVGPGEGCDDGNQSDDDECTNACALTTCGDGLVAPTEQCDDGNADDTDACTSACTQAACNDGVVQPGIGEVCDDGNANADDAACTLECQTAGCGDGHVWTDGGEACDDGPENGPGKACKADCELDVCGDGDPGPGEECDDGNLDPGDGCGSVCELEACGDADLDPGEACDDGQNGDPDDGCTDACQEPACGDGFVQSSLGEACDLGGANSDAGVCTLACEAATCGDGLVHAGVEQCDEGPANGPGKACKPDCSDNVCGDGDLGPGEACDDGNQIDDDGCTNVCKPSTCGDGVVQPGEACDLGPANSDTGACSLACQLPVCGDGVRQGDEGCDDGNQNDLDACSNDCVEQSVLEVMPGVMHTCARLSGGKIKCWGGKSQHNTLGWQPYHHVGDEPGEMGDAIPAVDLGTGNTAEVLRVAEDTTCAILQGGRLKCWGSPYWVGLEQPLGIVEMIEAMGDALPEVNLGPGAVAVDLWSGSQHTCVLLEGGVLKCFGNSEYGQLGYGNTAAKGHVAGTMGDKLATVDLGAGATVAQVRVGGAYSCALLTSGAVKCWGRNHFGTLGLGDTEHRGDGPGEMGDALPAIDFGSGVKVVQLATGENHACALLDSNAIKCWGHNLSGQLGLGDEENRGDQPGEMGDALPTVDLGDVPPVVALAASASTSCAVFADGTGKCWGSSGFGKLGIGAVGDRGDVPGSMGDALPRIQLGTGKKIASLTLHCSAGHHCAAFTDGTAKCWGSNSYGKLGLGDTVHRGLEPQHMGDNLPTVKLFNDAW